MKQTGSGVFRFQVIPVGMRGVIPRHPDETKPVLHRHIRGKLRPEDIAFPISTDEEGKVSDVNECFHVSTACCQPFIKFVCLSRRQ